MNKMEKKMLILQGTTLLMLSLGFQFFPAADAQPEKTPVLLVHGYASDASVWQKWVNLLQNDGIKAHSVTFMGNDACGRAVDHAKELKEIVKQFKMITGAEKINIVAHSKGGLDARVYLANNITNSDVANLIMIGTPNKGSIMADLFHNFDFCQPAVFDIMTNSPILNVQKNPHTQYHTIAGNWLPPYWYLPFSQVWFDEDCPPSVPWSFLEYTGINAIIGPDDGIVPVPSVESGGFMSLGRTDNCHTNLFGVEEYSKARGILNS
jgi:pimeloyl-ACP methyl ester carboxylesterase